MSETYHTPPSPVTPGPTGKGPFGDVLRDLKRGVDVETALRAGLGSQLASQVVRAAVAAELRTVRSTIRKAARKGGSYAPPRTARADLCAGIHHHANDAAVRKQAIAFVCIVSWMRPGSQRTGSWAQKTRLWLGRRKGDKPAGLAGRVGCSVRELERYFAVWRSAGLLKAWQPPKGPKVKRGKSGHAYNLYQLAVPMPLEVTKRVARFDTEAKAAEQPVTPATRTTERAPSSNGVAAQLIERFGLDDFELPF